MTEVSEPVKTADRLQKGLRDSLRGHVSDSQLESLVEAVVDAAQVKKKVWVSGGCDKCDCNHGRYVHVSDPKAVDLVFRLLEQLEGKPGTADGTAGSVVVRRTDVRAIEGVVA